MKLPAVVFQLLPIAALLGSLLGLGMLASRSELIVLRAAGMSPAGIARAVLVTGLVFAVVGGLLGEFVAPPLRALCPPVSGHGQVWPDRCRHRREHMDP